MSRLRASDVARVKEIGAELRAWNGDGSTILPRVLPALRELVDADKSCGYRADVDEQGTRLGFLYSAGFNEKRMREVISEWFAKSPRPVAYNPAIPEKWQRNRALVMKQLVGTTGHPTVQQEWPRIGLAGHDQVRVLVCDGPSLLAFVGAFRPEPFADRSRHLLQAVVPALQRRLRLERQLADAQVNQVTLEAALEALGVPAFVVANSGRVRHTNTAGRAALEADGLRVRQALAHPAGRFDVTPLRVPGMPEQQLLVERRARGDVAPQVAAAAARWSLTPRQREVLALVAIGRANKTIADQLRCTNRTVELHVSALLAKAEVDSRAALVAKLWSEL